MISRRDKLLVRPWEQRRYEYHRRKVQSAIPAIDVGPPANRIHVCYKLKKQQKEKERCSKIETDNLKLLQRLRNCMSTSRVDNNWTTAQPNFLNKVTIYNKTSNKVSNKIKDAPVLNNCENTREGRCSACTPKEIAKPKIPEERVPWEPPKLPVGRKRSQSLPPQTIKLETEANKPKQDNSRKNSLTKPPQKIEETQQTSKQRSRSSRSLVRRQNKDFLIDKQQINSFDGQTIILSRDNMNLSVNFPSDTSVKFKDGYNEKFLVGEPCQCKLIRT